MNKKYLALLLIFSLSIQSAICMFKCNDNMQGGTQQCEESLDPINCNDCVCRPGTADEDYGGSSDQNDGICVVTCGNGRKDFVDSSSSLSATNLNGRQQCDDPNDPFCDPDTCQCLSGTQPDGSLGCQQFCGNGLKSPSEECDTGLDHTYCNEQCKIKAGYDCTDINGERSFCFSVCGNGIKTEDEACDAGTGNPGCINCVVQPFYNCSYVNNFGTSLCVLLPGCGNKVVENDQQCDNNGGVGCHPNCTIIQNFTCTGSPSVCQSCGNNVVEGTEACDGTTNCTSNCTLRGCNNGFLEIGENCDNGGGNGDGCSNNCFVEQKFTCKGEYEVGKPSECTRLYICNNSIYEPYNVQREQCDNGNVTGCINCTVDAGYYCQSLLFSKSVCFLRQTPNCGNGVQNAFEFCDDGDKQNGDGCSDKCLVENGFECPLFYLCFNLTGNQCGNGYPQISLGEQCDDNNTKSGDGCSSTCIIQNTHTCRSDAFFLLSICKTKCGDGIQSAANNEDCDDGDNDNGDGCSSTCKLQSGFNCQLRGEGIQTVCVPESLDQVFCGNGYINQGEQCDDGFYPQDGDGCNRLCQIEYGWICRPRYDHVYRGISDCCLLANPACLTQQSQP